MTDAIPLIGASLAQPGREPLVPEYKHRLCEFSSLNFTCVVVHLLAVYWFLVSEFLSGKFPGTLTQWG